jgi:hypothetical protein
LNWENNSVVCVLPMALSPKTVLTISCLWCSIPWCEAKVIADVSIQP